MATFRACVIDKPDGGKQTVALREFSDDDLMPGDVTVRVTHSGLNYKDGLALTGRSPVVRRFPMIPGVDFAGTVEASDSPDFNVGDAVVLTGWGVGETHLGGYGQRARVKSGWLVALPEGLTAADAMAIGTAGFTSMLAVLAIEQHGLTPSSGPVVVTGAAGGVGSVAITLLANAGWHVIASTGRAEAEGDYLRGLGAAEVIDRAGLSAAGRPMGKERWAAGVDSVGSHTLANLLSMTKYGGVIAACGLAQGMDLPASVAPFILRGVSLVGIESVMCPRERRIAAWQRLARDLDRNKLHAMTRTVSLDDVIAEGERILAGTVRGRTVVAIE
jgi:acrylyl-CoA reductase (NADPH)